MKNLQSLLLVFSLVLIGQQYSLAQPNQEVLDQVLVENDEKEVLAAATALIIDGFLYKAEPFVENLYARDADNPQYNYLKGFITMYYHKDHKDAIGYFNKAVKSTDKKLNLLEPETDVTYDVLFHLAHAQHFLGDIENAEKNYKLFLAESRNNAYLMDEAEIRVQQIEVAKALLDKPTDAIIEPLDIVNTDNPEYSPVLSANGRELYFTTRREWEGVDQDRYRNPFDNTYPEDTYYSLRDRVNGWDAGTKLPLCKALINEASISLTPNMNQLFIYSDSIGNGNIFYTDYSMSDFKAVDVLEVDKLNTRFWETHFVISPDSTLIVFSSDRKHGEGGRDLWYMEKDDNDNWSKPKNMGPGINTEGEEDSPFLMLDGKDLYYATNGPNSMGGFDIMKAEYKDGTWSKGVNVGAPINSTGDDIFFTTSYNGKDAYFSSFRPGGKGEKDIYRITYDEEQDNGADIIALEGGIINVTDNAEEVELRVTLKNLRTNKTEPVLVKHGDFFNILDDCTEYELTYTNTLNNKELSKETFKTNCSNEKEYLVKYYYNGQYILDGTITEVGTETPLKNVNLEIYNLDTKELIGTVQTGENGYYSFDGLENLAPGDELALEIRANLDGYVGEVWKVNKTLDTSGEIKWNENLEGEDNIDNFEDILAEYIIYYDFDKSNIKNSEKEVLDKVVKLMNENPELKIELSSHTDCRGSSSYNMGLSERRAASAKKYIAERITNPERITAKGYGETQLTNGCDCQEGHACPSKDHSLNRRTEFKVIR